MGSLFIFGLHSVSYWSTYIYISSEFCSQYSSLFFFNWKLIKSLSEPHFHSEQSLFPAGFLKIEIKKKKIYTSRCAWHNLQAIECEVAGCKMSHLCFSALLWETAKTLVWPRLAARKTFIWRKKTSWKCSMDVSFCWSKLDGFQITWWVREEWEGITDNHGLGNVTNLKHVIWKNKNLSLSLSLSADLNKQRIVATLPVLYYHSQITMRVSWVAAVFGGLSLAPLETSLTSTRASVSPFSRPNA